MEQEEFKIIKCFLITVGVAIAYVVMARLGLMYALNPGFATAFFPSSGLAVAAILIFGTCAWSGIFLGSLIVNLITSIPMMTGTSFFVSATIAVGSTLQSLAVAHVLTKCISSKHLLTLRRNVIIFLLMSVLFCMISATFGTVTLFISDVIPSELIVQNWVTWWVGDFMGVWIFCPLILYWSKVNPRDIFSKRGLEGLILVLIVITIGVLCFGGKLKSEYDLEFLLIPCLLWASFRCNPYIVTFLLALISFLALWGTSSGVGPFSLDTLNESLILLQSFTGVMTVMTLLLISTVQELNYNNRALEDLNQKLFEQNLFLQNKNQSDKKS